MKRNNVKQITIRLTADEYAVIDTKMREKYRPKIGTIFVKIPLTEPK